MSIVDAPDKEVIGSIVDDITKDKRNKCRADILELQSFMVALIPAPDMTYSEMKRYIEAFKAPHQQAALDDFQNCTAAAMKYIYHLPPGPKRKRARSLAKRCHNSNMRLLDHLYLKLDLPSSPVSNRCQGE